MRFEGFVGQSYVANSVNLNCQRTMNLYPETDESGYGKERTVMSLIRVSGYRLLNGAGSGPQRGMFVTASGRAFTVSGTTLYEITDVDVPVSRGILSTSTGQVSIEENGVHLLMVDGTAGYTFELSTNTFATITDEDFPNGAKRVSFIDGYFIVDVPGTGRFQHSDLNAVTWDALDDGEGESNPDYLVGHVSFNQGVWLFSAKTTEVFFNSGESSNTFQRVSGAVIDMGCAAAFSIQVIAETVCWLGQNKKGFGGVYAAQGYQPQKISTTAVDIAIQSYGDVSDATSWSYQMDGHSFYVLNFPTADKTWVFDLSTRMWHERGYFNNGEFSRDRIDCHIFFNNMHIVGDSESSALYKIDKNYHYQDISGANEIRWERTVPHVTSGLTNVFHNSLEIDMHVGVGLDGAITTQGYDPQVILQFSDDDGRTWSSEIPASMGKLGETQTRVKFNRLGRSRKRVYRLSGSEPVKTIILGAEIELEKGAS